MKILLLSVENRSNTKHHVIVRNSQIFEYVSQGEVEVAWGCIMSLQIFNISGNQQRESMIKILSGTTYNMSKFVQVEA